MEDAKKNRDPERARARAKSDARCALRKLGLLERIEEWYSEDKGDGEDLLIDIARALEV